MTLQTWVHSQIFPTHLDVHVRRITCWQRSPNHRAKKRQQTLETTSYQTLDSCSSRALQLIQPYKPPNKNKTVSTFDIFLDRFQKQSPSINFQIPLQVKFKQHSNLHPLARHQHSSHLPTQRPPEDHPSPPSLASPAGCAAASRSCDFSDAFDWCN